MKKQFVTYEIALKLKELGFDEPCFGYYDESGKLKQFPNADVFWNKNSKISYNRSIRFMFQEKKAAALLCTAPLWQQAVDWLREKYKIRVCNLVNIHIEATFIVYHSINADVIQGNNFYEARKQAILKAIALIQTDKNK